jgi:hypothetical protein
MVWEFWIKVTRKWQSGASFGVVGRSVKGGGVRRRGLEEERKVVRQSDASSWC